MLPSTTITSSIGKTNLCYPPVKNLALSDSHETKKGGPYGTYLAFELLHNYVISMFSAKILDLSIKLTSTEVVNFHEF